MTQHLDVDALADLLVGEGDAAAVAHLESCVDCAGRLGELSDAVEATDPLLAALAASPVPALPDGFEERLAVRLEQEAREQAQQPARQQSAQQARDGDEGDGAEGDGDRRSGTVVPLQPRRARPRSAGLLGVAAGAAGLLVAGALGLSLLGGGLDGGASESAAGALAGPESADLGADQGADQSTDQGTSGDGGAAGGAVAGEAAPGTVGDARVASGAAVQSSGVDYRPEAAYVRDLLPGLLAGDYRGLDVPASRPAPVAAAQEDSGGPGVSAMAGQADPLARLREPQALEECVTALADGSAGADPTASPLALDYTTSQGQPALVVALPAPGGLVEVSAVGPGCSAADPQRLWSLRVAG